eukprot:13815138-Alexandrium_andersonii.AAC.1
MLLALAAKEQRPKETQRMDTLRGACCNLGRLIHALGGRHRPGRKHRALEPSTRALQLGGLARPGCESSSAGGGE